MCYFEEHNKRRKKKGKVHCYLGTTKSEHTLVESMTSLCNHLGNVGCSHEGDRLDIRMIHKSIDS